MVGIQVVKMELGYEAGETKVIRAVWCLQGQSVRKKVMIVAGGMGTSYRLMTHNGETFPNSPVPVPGT